MFNFHIKMAVDSQIYVFFSLFLSLHADEVLGSLFGLSLFLIGREDTNI